MKPTWRRTPAAAAASMAAAETVERRPAAGSLGLALDRRIRAADRPSHTGMATTTARTTRRTTAIGPRRVDGRRRMAGVYGPAICDGPCQPLAPGEFAAEIVGYGATADA